MKSIVTNNTPGLTVYDGITGDITVTTSNGDVDVAQAPAAPAATPDTLEMNSKKGIFVSEATEIDAGGVPVTGGGLIFVSDGKLKYRGSTGTITTVADA
jgi:hypothetical protein